ncbi:hypothetical protein TWF696_004411 [Orbilia brochopaga]|uniref:Uncharacterized protein n=1 Tax=Orbilia brochopaga TaxID=3140254 RepID=A0AAV9V610_9PEZI
MWGIINEGNPFSRQSNGNDLDFSPFLFTGDSFLFSGSISHRGSSFSRSPFDSTLAQQQ